MIHIIILISAVALLLKIDDVYSAHTYSNEKKIVKGLSFVAPPDRFTTNPFIEIKQIEANFISVIPYAFMKQDDPMVYYYGGQNRWWGETPDGVIDCIQMAHEKGLNVMLKPSVWMRNTWTGDLNFENTTQLNKWQKTYHKYILDFAKMADSMQVEIFCIGNEFKKLAFQHPNFWYSLITDVKNVYKGKITYASNWDAYHDVVFWDALDYIGINAYFPLIDKKDASMKDLVNSWQPIERKIRKTAQAFEKPVLFTEYGYLSVDGATHNTWELEKQIRDLPINEKVQSKAFEALYSVFWDKNYWAGGFIWKWYPYERNRLDYHQRDYTPQGKISEKTIHSWFQKDSSK